MKTAYLIHILLWMTPILAGQWIIGRRILQANLQAILIPTAIASIYLTMADSIAIRSGIWFFDPKQNLGVKFGPWVPLEEFIFFVMTSLLVAQSLILFLPGNLRHKTDHDSLCQKS